VIGRKTDLFRDGYMVSHYSDVPLWKKYEESKVLLFIIEEDMANHITSVPR